MKSETPILKRRVYAFTTDLGVIVACNYFLMTSFTQFVKTVFFHFPIKVQMLLINKMAIMSSMSLMSLTFAYFSIFYFVTNGRSFGKSMFGLQVKTHDGEELTLKQSMVRAFAYFTCAMLGSFLFALSFIRKDQKSLADVFSGTRVGIDTLDEKVKGTEFQLTLLEASFTHDENDHDDSTQEAA